MKFILLLNPLTHIINSDSQPEVNWLAVNKQYGAEKAVLPYGGNYGQSGTKQAEQ